MRSSILVLGITDFLKFIYKPNCEKSTDSCGVRIQKLMLLFLTVLFIKVLLIVTNTFFISASLKEDIAEPGLTILIVSCSLGPFLEEIAFRLPLLFSSLNLSLSTGTLSFYLINRFFSVENHYDIGNYFFLRVLIAITMGVIVWLMSKKYSHFLRIFYENRFSLIVYFYSLIFAAMHIGNYEMKSSFLLTFAWIALSPFLSGLLFSFARLKYGFLYSLSLHLINNAIPTIIHFVI